MYCGSIKYRCCAVLVYAGVDFVLVNGTIVVEKGNHNGNRPGRVLFGPGYRGN